MVCDLVFSLQEFLKIVPGLAIFPLSFYLAWKKIGTSISCSITMRSNRITARRISNVVLTNHKDRPITIFAIQAVAKDISFVVEEFDPPIVLKALETMTIDTRPYSMLELGDSEWEPDFLQKLEIFLITPRKKAIKCKEESHPSVVKMRAFNHLKTASKITKTFNGVAYNDKAKYAISFKQNSDIKTAIVDISGFINDPWKYTYNMIPAEFLQSEETLKSFLKTTKADVALQICSVDFLPNKN